MRIFLTARDTPHRLSEFDAPLESLSKESHPSVWVDPSRRFQVVEGFGGAFTEAAAVSWLKLSDQKRQELLESYFSGSSGHDYSFCRVHMNSCDFSLGNYAHVEQAGDIDLNTFSIERDHQALIPFIQAAQRIARKPIKLLASPWSPPAWMKDNGQMNHGGKLLPQYRQTWAKCYVKFIQAYEAIGIPIWGVSVQNEPAATQRWDSCIYSAEEERDFVRDWLGPELHAAGLQAIRVVIWDHNRDLMVERAATVYNDTEAAKYVWGTGFHWYGEDHFDHVQLHHDAWPEKKLLFTEGCQEGGSHRGSWALGERYARSMINDLNRWTVGWIDWNLALNLEGGPNHVNNFCSAPILVDGENDSFELQSSYFYIGHFSRFIKPGAKRILCAASKEELECTAFINPDGDVVIVVMNRLDSHQSFQIQMCGAAHPTELPAYSIATYLVFAPHLN
jgi:glucosylceramidase